MPASSPALPTGTNPDYRYLSIAALTIVCIALHLGLRFLGSWSETVQRLPLLVALVLGGLPLVWELLQKLFQRQFGSDLLAGISIVTSVLLDEWLAGALVVLMLSGGEALESYAVRSASSVLQALARRMPTIAHRKRDEQIEDIRVDQLQIGDSLIVFPHDICPVDGVVTAGRGVMDESYLTGEPYRISKMPGAAVLSGAINGESALTISATRLAEDSRYAKIMQVMQTSQQQRPQLRRLGDRLGAVYTPLAVGLGVAAWILTGDPLRFLAVLVVATPCPLLIGIPVAIIGSISLAARRAIIVRDPAVLEVIDTCQSMIFDKTGTLTYGRPNLVEQTPAPQLSSTDLLARVASLEQYSKHPLASAILEAANAEQLSLHEVTELQELPGQGLVGKVDQQLLQITSRSKALAMDPAASAVMPPTTSGLECIIMLDGRYAGTYRFRDTPRREGARFVKHLSHRHQVQRVVLISGDRTAEVSYLAEQVGITEFYGDQSPEDKLAFVQQETQRSRTVFVGDGINDAPALMAATVGIAFGHNSDVTSEAAGAVIMDSSLSKVDELLHIGRRMRAIALQSAVGGMLLSLVGMALAAAGYLPPVAGAVAQEIIDVAAVLNALRAAFPVRELIDF